MIYAVRVLRSDRERALELLPQHLHVYLDQRIMPSSWYPLEHHLGLLSVIAQLWPVGAGDPWMLMGRTTAQLDFGGLYKGLLRVGQPGRSLLQMGPLWRTAQDTGDVSVVTDAQSARVTRRNFPLRSAEFCRTTLGYIAETVRLAGGQDGKFAHETCTSEGATECVFEVRWH